MKTSKKFIAGVSAFLLAISSAMVTVSAVTTEEDSTTGFQVLVSGSQESLEAGSTFDVTVDLKSVPETGIAGCEFAVSFDSDIVELQAVSENTSLTGDAASAEIAIVPDLSSTMISGDSYSCLDYVISDGKVAMLWATGLGQDYFINEDGTLVTLTFQVKADAEDSSSDIGIEAIRDEGSVLFASADADGNYVEQDVDYGGTATIVVGDGGSNTTSTSTSTTVTTSGSGSNTETTTSNATIGSSSSDGGLMGDVTSDGAVKNNDVQLIRQHILHMVDLDESVLVYADIDKDGNVKNNDVQLIRQYILHMIDSLDL